MVLGALPIVGLIAVLAIAIALKRRLSLIEDALNCTHSAFVIYDRDNRLILGNDSYKDLLGLPNRAMKAGARYEDLMRQSLSRTMPPHELEAEVERRVAIQAAGDGQPSDRHYSGDRWLRVSKTRTKRGANVGIGIDVTEYHLLKTEREAETERFSALASNAPVGICQVGGPQNEIFFVNHTLLSMLGVQRLEDLGPAQLRFTASGLEFDGFEAFLTHLRSALPETDARIETADGPRYLLIKNALLHFSALVDLPEDQRATGESIIIFIDITERTEAQHKIRYLAMHDKLTGAGNRAAFTKAINLAARSASEDRPLTLIAIDLNRFKPVNDKYGHAAGDALLKQVAKRIDTVLAPSMSLFRMGGDEFTVLCAPDGHHVGIEVARTIRGVIEQPCYIDGNRLSISASIGLSVLPQDTDTIQSLLHYADLALYKAKYSGRDDVGIFDNSVLEHANKRGLLEIELRQAVEDRSFDVIYQPQYSLDRAAPIGVEAFVRWRRSGNSALLRPDRFIGLAEELRLVDKIDFIVIEQAIAEFARVLHHPEAPRTMSLNPSIKTLQNAKFPGHLGRVLREAQVPAERVVVELRRTANVGDVELAKTIEAIAALVVTFTLDDVGTSPTSLRLIADMPLWAIKIDGAIARAVDGPRGERAARIVRAIVDMAHHLKIKVIAGGIESEVGFKTLSELGCDIFQGHLFGPVGQPLAALRDNAVFDPQFVARRDVLAASDATSPSRPPPIESDKGDEQTFKVVASS